ncbi:hypothetical protein NUW54_g1049 [Trametes sanguinea]|uniref:Uncharacterized protein n=1 Tax=Trametes sanguinea TaxID=158606 RepID=A0ACC1Q8S7_9APHY|nr:hypothetical protein NUW54_g1049 [Trametes sanguinea]
MQNARNFVLDLLDEPDKFIDHAKRYAASVIMSLTYGKMTPTSYSDPEVKQINLLVERLGSAMRPGAHLVDSYPFLKYIPGFTSELKKWHKEELELFSSQIRGVKERLAKNEAYPCFATTLLERQEEFGLNDDELAYLAGSMFGAGSDTTAGVLPIVIMAAARHPQIQARVQAQLDKVVGRDRLPTFEDWEKLTEVATYVQEVYRWRPVTPLGFAHRATKDVAWNGYVIPAGTEVLACHWAIARDPDVFPDPEAFKPERWLDEKGQLREDLKFFNWGFGRRICPGLHVAERSVFINTALTLWAFEIHEDPAHPIDTFAIKDGALAHPYPFVVRFKPRIPNLREKILAHNEPLQLLNEYTDHEVHLFEADSRPGGHANTVTYSPPGKEDAEVDTGFIVFNPSTYPNFISFLKMHPDLAKRILPTEMTFSVSRDGGAFEWAGNNLLSVFCQPSRLLDPNMWRLLYDVLRFNANAQRLLLNFKFSKGGTRDGELSIGEYLQKHGYSDWFRDNYLIPMTAAIWSTPPDKCALDFPARTLIQFMFNHHLLQITGKPSWLTLRGGSRTYVKKIIASLPASQVHLSTPIRAARTVPTLGDSQRDSQVLLETASGDNLRFDEVIMACHTDTTVDILNAGGGMSAEETRILGKFKWNRNEAVLHRDERVRTSDKHDRTTTHILFHGSSCQSQNLRGRAGTT